MTLILKPHPALRHKKVNLRKILHFDFFGYSIYPFFLNNAITLFSPRYWMPPIPNDFYITLEILKIFWSGFGNFGPFNIWGTCSEIEKVGDIGGPMSCYMGPQTLDEALRYGKVLVLTFLVIF